MKQVLYVLVLLILVLPVCVQGQANLPPYDPLNYEFAPIGAEWTYVEYIRAGLLDSLSGDTVWFEFNLPVYYKSIGDTTIGSKQYRIVLEILDTFSVKYDTISGEVFEGKFAKMPYLERPIYIHQDDTLGNVYYYDTCTGGPVLLFLFQTNFIRNPDYPNNLQCPVGQEFEYRYKADCDSYLTMCMYNYSYSFNVIYYDSWGVDTVPDFFRFGELFSNALPSQYIQYPFGDFLEFLKNISNMHIDRGVFIFQQDSMLYTDNRGRGSLNYHHTRMLSYQDSRYSEDPCIGFGEDFVCYHPKWIRTSPFYNTSTAESIQADIEVKRLSGNKWLIEHLQNTPIGAYRVLDPLGRILLEGNAVKPRLELDFNQPPSYLVLLIPAHNFFVRISTH